MNVQQMQEYKQLRETVLMLSLQVEELQKKVEALELQRPIISRKRQEDAKQV